MAKESSRAASSLRSHRNHRRRRYSRKIDLISSLPDEILQHILFFVPTKLAIRTSVFSRRWRHVWSDTPCLFFDDDKLHAAAINQTLTRYTAPKMMKFHLKSAWRYSFHDMDRWIEFAMSRSVENLSLCIDFIDGYKFPDSLYMNSSIKQLSFQLPTVPRCSVSWTSLKKLSLRYSMLSDESFAKILSGSPILESLTLCSDCRQLTGGPIQIVAPQIHCLILRNYVPSCTLVDVSSLTEAKVDIEIYDKIESVLLEAVMFKMVKKMVKKLENAEKLTFGGSFLMFTYVGCTVKLKRVPRLMSAMSGLQGEVEGFGTNALVISSIVILVALFSIQRFGTGKVGFLFAPVLALWFFSLGAIGIYNLLKYDITVIRALNPFYIVLFFKKNSKQAWSALGGCVLCITGAEAMFADLGHFSVRSIQMAFTCVVFPCLLLAYMGQAAYLTKHPDASARIFYDSVPGIAEVGVMMVSTVLVTLVMLLIWQTNLFLALCFPLVFGSVETIYLLAVLTKILEGGWVPLVFATFFLTVMYIWNYGSVLKYQSEVRERISMDFMRELGSTLGTIRIPGIGLLYNELVQGIPSIFGQFLLTLPAIHSTIIFVCIKYVPVPVVPQEERFLFRRVCPRDYHIFRCIARYGYKDVRKEDSRVFEQLLIESLEKFLRCEALEDALESNLNDFDPDRVSVASDTYTDDLMAPLINRSKRSEPEQELDSDVLPSSSVGSSMEEDPALEYELAALREAMDSGLTYLLAHGDVRAKKNSIFLKKLVINYFYAFLRRNCRAGAANLTVPHMNILQAGMTYMV
uniref:KUP12.1 n=1 Tax=Olimarabidopsis pumila TaxID=74718 RepID=A0A977IVX3_OLIPU|nr:KUP12.1 [Olimarabidopsis pumila]